MSEFGNNIRRIVGVDEIKKRLDALEEADPIESKRGLAWNDGANAAARTATGAAGGSGITAPGGAVGSGLAAALRSATQAAIDALNGALNAGGAGITSPTDGIYSLSDLLDNLRDKFLQGGGDGLGSFNPALGGINGFQDCETGTDGLLRTRVQDTAPPLTWTDSETPPSSVGWQFGYWWEYAGAKASTPSAACQAGILLGAFPDATFGGGAITGTDGLGNANQWTFQVQFEPPPIAPVAVNVVRNGTGASCTATQGGTICPAEEPADYTWELDYFQLFKNTDGKWSYNQYDPNVPLHYTQPTSTAYMCFEEGSRSAVLTPGAGDTTLLYETDPSDGSILPDTIVHIYDGNMQLKGYADAASLSNYTP